MQSKCDVGAELTIVNQILSASPVFAHVAKIAQRDPQTLIGSKYFEC
jgi:hypothetical protein